MGRSDTAVVFARQQRSYTARDILSAAVWPQSAAMSYAGSIAKFRKARGLSQSRLAELMEVEQPTIQRWESGSRRPSAQRMVELARVFGVNASELFSEGEPVALGPSIFLKGEVAAGQWAETYKLPEDEWKAFTGRPDIAASMEHRFSLRVVDEVADQIYPPGTVLECVSTEANIELSSGKRVIVVRTREDGLCEAVIREYFVDGEGVEWLLPKSKNPSLQTPMRLDQPESGIVETRIAAIVVGAQIWE